ncbi:TRAP transporter permease [Brevibacillus humidisoli]|uniref:TRAP transporter permease n=1 Tax=Brevibacillus humidisoli TaxID=2895522 RepID=UPI001E5E875E|nr:TRAP transporter permease [Brevibacillus humidisoli]UFJ42001.1 TRAP transporter permease [Brevibacillus humidisoli]
MARKYLRWVPLVAIIWALFQLYLAAVGPLTAQLQRSIHVAFALALTFLLVRRGENAKNGLVRQLDYLFALVSIASGLYIYFEADRLVSRIQFVSELTAMDYAVCISITLLILEASRRTVGKAMTILAVFFLFYAFAGAYFPGPLAHTGISLKRMVEIMYFSLEGILGVPIGVSVDYVFYFVLFAAFLDRSGGGKLFIDLAFKMTKRSKGGPAKAAILGSGGMGTISGSAIGNVVSTGVFTIPLMKRAGYTPTFAASIEALASTGGQILPPIMGAAAFIMADTVGIPYVDVALAALIPAVLYFVSLYVMVHLEAGKKNLQASPDNTSDKAAEQTKEKLLGRLHLLLPLAILIILIFSGKTLQLSAFWSIVTIVAVSFLRKATRMSVTDILDALVDGAKQAIQVAIPCAVAGIVVGVIIHSGLGLKFSSMIVNYSFGIPLLSVLLVCLGCIILGMGMPTTSAYIMGAVLLAPSLQSLGFEPIASHLFILYLACLSMVTPPVALAAYSAASIAQCDANRTGYLAFFLCIPGFLIPLSFVFNPALVLVGDPLEIIWMTIKTLLGLIAMSGAIIGFLLVKVEMLQRVLLAATGLAMIVRGQITDIIGILLFIVLLAFLWKEKKKGERIAVESL